MSTLIGMISTGQHRVVKDYATAYPDPLTVKLDDLVALGRRDDEFPGWVWCTDGQGKSGWVPEAFLELVGPTEGADTQGRMRRDYDATEMTVSAGQMLTILERESGWAWCISSAGKRGWVPLDNLEPA